MHLNRSFPLERYLIPSFWRLILSSTNLDSLESIIPWTYQLFLLSMMPWIHEPDLSETHTLGALFFFTFDDDHALWMSLTWIYDLVDYAHYCHTDETMLHTFYTGIRRWDGKGKGAIPYQVDLGWCLMSWPCCPDSPSGEVFCFPSYLDLAGFCSFPPMSLALGFFDVNHRRDAAFIEIIIGRGRHPDSKT